MSKQKSKTKRPNIIIFLMDTQGTTNMSCYGYRRKTTPNIDALAKESCLFEQHFVTGSWTLPAHASLFTGRYESGHGAGAQHEGLESGIPQMPELLSQNGYRTVAVNNNYWAANKTNWSPGKGFDEVIHYNDPEIPAVAPWIPSDNPDEQDKGALKGIGVAHKWIEDAIGILAANPASGVLDLQYAKLILTLDHDRKLRILSAILQPIRDEIAVDRLKSSGISAHHHIGS